MEDLAKCKRAYWAAKTQAKIRPAHRNRRGPPRKVKIIKPRKNRRIGTPFPESEKEGTDAA